MLKAKIDETGPKHEESAGGDCVGILDFDDRQKRKGAHHQAAGGPGQHDQIILPQKVHSVTEGKDGSNNVAHGKNRAMEVRLHLTSQNKNNHKGEIRVRTNASMTPT